MFRGKLGIPAADPDRYLPELRLYVREHYQRKPEADIRYSLPVEDQKRHRYSPEGTLLDETDRERMPVSPAEAQRDLSLLDSPAMKRYYRSWEKKKAVTTTFSAEVTRMVQERFRKASEFYLSAGIDKRTFHKIRSDYLYRPSRNTAMKCCLGLKLNREEAERLMQLAGYSFSPSEPSDLVILFCIEKEIWDLASVNYLMGSFDLKDLDGYVPD